MVRKKQMMMRSAMITTKMKLEKVSKPSHLENAVRGSGKIEIMRKTIGSKSHAMELLMEMVFFLSETMISSSRRMVATIISICRLVIFTPSES